METPRDIFAIEEEPGFCNNKHVKTVKRQFQWRSIIRNYAYMLVWLAFVGIVVTTVVPQEYKQTLKRFTQGIFSSSKNCTSSAECGNGHCLPDGPTSFSCQCDSGYISRDGTCDYQQKDKVVTFLVAFFVGWLGVPYFYLARGNCCYVCMGVTNLFTVGIVGFWWTAMWIMVLCDALPDGNGVALKPW